MAGVTEGILSGGRRTFAAAALFSMFGNALILALPLFTLQVYDRVLSSRSGATLLMLTVVTGGALGVHAILEAVRSRLMVLVGVWLGRRWSGDLLAQAVRRAPAKGAGAAQPLRDLATVRGFIGSPGIFHLFDSPWVPLYGAVMFMLHPALGWLAVGGALALFGLALASELLTRAPLRASGVGQARQLQRADEYVRRSEVIEAMGMLPALTRLWTEQGESAERQLAQGWGRASLISAAARFTRFGVQVAVVATGAWLAVNDQLSGGGIIAGSIVLSRALSPVESLVGSWKNFVSARAALGRIHAQMAEPPPVQSSTRLPAPSGILAFERVRVEMPGLDRPILADIEFRLAPGEALGIIGPSTAGKSTLARVALGIQATSRGRARLDGADVATWNREDLGRRVGYLPQDILLFPGTVRRNIARMGVPDDSKVVEAARLAGVHEMILRLPQGYDTEIDDASRALSGGQRQRVAIARALYGDPRLLVLDEPNSNLDAEGEAALIRALLRARERGITTLVIAHRARILTVMDRLLFLKDGRIEMLGPQAEVMARVLPQPPLARPAASEPALIREARQ